MINFERWLLKLIEIGQLISFEEEGQLYKNFKIEAKVKRKDRFK